MKTLKFFLIMLFTVFINFNIYSQLVYKWVNIPTHTNNNLNRVNQNFIAGNEGWLFKAITGDYSRWQHFPLSTFLDLQDVYMSTNSFIVGNNQVILRSTNNGNNWSQVYISASGKLNSISLTGTNSYTAVGELGGQMLKTTNNGLNWFYQSAPTSDPLNGIVISGSSVYLIGNNGKMYKSTDFGGSYSPVPTGTTANLSHIHMLAGTGYIVGANGVILKSTDNGLSWASQSSGSNTNLNSVFILDNQKIWITGDSGLILKTTNGGINWLQEQITPPINLNSIYFYTAENAVIAGDNGLILNRQLDSTYLPYINLKTYSISTWITNSGIFNQDKRTFNTPGFQWPNGSGKYAIFSSGFTIAAYVNNSIRMAAASYTGEFKPGYCVNGVYQTDSRFKFYKVKSGQHASTNPDWLNWGIMVPFGAPYIDYNNNGSYEPFIDTPGVRGAAETIFLCMTDADPASHTEGEGFGGGTQPLGAEVGFTACVYNNPGFEDFQFLRWQVTNKSTQNWNSTFFSIISDPDLGLGTDDYIGCDTTLNLAYCYNGDNIDGDGTGYSYGQNPPAVGFTLIRGAHIIPSQDLGMTTVSHFACNSCSQAPCESAPQNVTEAYNYISGFKRDRTPWIDPLTSQVTKYCYPGDPETNSGWTERKGRILNCGGSLTGQEVTQNTPFDRRLLLSTGDTNFTMVPGAKQTIVAAQLIARGSSNLSSVTRLKRLSDDIHKIYNMFISVGITPVSHVIPSEYMLHQNYPNPFNPETTIKFDIPKAGFVKLTVYDISGREIATLVNEQLTAGSYDINWNGSQYASGVYFYKLETETFSDVRRMVLVK